MRRNFHKCVSKGGGLGETPASLTCWKYRPVKGRVGYFNTYAHSPDCLNVVQEWGKLSWFAIAPLSLSLSLSLSPSLSLHTPPLPPSPTPVLLLICKTFRNHLRYGCIYEVERHTTGDSLVPGGTDTNDGVSVQRTNIRMVCARFNYSVNVFYDTVIILFQIL